MTLIEALRSARAGNFVTHESFDSEQSLHFYNGNYYYEDGAIVPDEFLFSQAWAVEKPWHIKINKEDIDRNILKKMHDESRGYMLNTGSYEDCKIITRLNH